MERKFNKVILLIFIIAFTFLFSFLKINNNVQAITIDYSIDETSKTDITYSELVKLLTNQDTSANENSYFNYINESTNPLSINKLIPKNNVTYDLDGSTLSIHAYSYSYQDKNQNTHIWTPSKITVGETEQTPTFNGTNYSATFNNVNDSINTIEVSYSCNYVIDKDKSNELINLAYNDASSFVNNKVEETEKAKYDENLSQYNQYLIDYNNYLDNLNEYNNYLIEKENYDQAKKEYDEYLIELDDYNNKLKEYQDYLKARDDYANNLSSYQQYLIDLENYNNALEQYNLAYPSYKASLDIYDHQLAVVDAINYGMIFGSGENQEERSVYNAIMGSTVTSVLSQKADLEILNADQDAIDRAETATINLREIFTQYFEKETNQEKYSFYNYREGFSYVNYKKLKTNMEELLRCLDKLYRSGRVEEALIVKGKKEKYIFLVAQLAYICNALSDDSVYNYEAWVNGSGNLNRTGALVFDDTWTIDGRTISQILGSSNTSIIQDNTVQAYPLSANYPEELVEPIEPTIVTEPVMPETVTEPTIPETVTEPTAPTEVSEPIEPTVVEQPIEYIVNDNLKNIVNDYKNGSLIKRTEFNSDQTITIYSNVTKNFRNSDTVTIEFYDNDNNLIGSETTDKDSYIVFNTKVVKNSDAINKEYIFSGWTYEDGSTLDLNNVKRSGFVYPTYTEIKQEYIVTWIIDNTEIKETYYYRDTPSYKNTINKSSDINDNKAYEFIGWDKEITSVTSDVTYTALFSENELVSQASSVEKVNNDIYININEVNDLDLSKLITENENINKIVIDTVLYEVIINNNDNNTKNVRKNVNSNNLNIKTISVNVINNNKDIDINVNYTKIDDSDNNKIDFEFILYGKFDSSHNVVNLGEEEITPIYKSSYIKFNVQANKTYIISKKYLVNLTSNEFVSYKVNNTSYKEGSLVNIDIETIKEGKEVTSVYYINSKNEKTIINYNDNKYSFNMPSDDIYIGVIVSDCIYVVEFYDNDNLIYSKEYKYGEALIKPSDPTRLSDETYSYTFVGWMENGEIVTVNETVLESHKYVASFEAKESELGPLEQSRGKIIPTIIIISVLIVFGIPSLIIFINKKKKGSNKKEEFINLVR